jgi:hypothetical protein
MRWGEFKSQLKEQRVKRRDYGVAALTAAGVPFELVQESWHLRIEWRGETIDYTPGTGSWSIKGKRSKDHGLHRGLHSLLRYLATGEAPKGPVHG